MQTVYVADDEPGIRELLSMVLTRAGYDVESFADGEALLAAVRDTTPACILLDVVLPGRSGLEILKALSGENYPAPIFMISGRGDIPTAVAAIRSGALDFIENPFRGSEIVERVAAAIAAFAEKSSIESRPSSEYFAGREALTKRELEVLDRIVSGLSNKEAGRLLGISPRTMEEHRANIMRKLAARNTADLVRIVHARAR